ncbi:peptidoglycan-binding protein [Pararhizobium sp.]|uniref:peptidoglycan-binding protein n=1 Tax=Pararhizobium sp. TaxID=1977563 RepID=UPI002728718B|nr:peptidoglycan-binding protein [Pararhizobium sp.]MDO9416304.1 peptidoglycan-binding protein [Pararhizobium sp.]
MNGSRSNTPRPGERSSLDALNRTIEGLEARIEGLLGSTARETRPPQRLQERSQERLQERAPERYAPVEARLDPVSEIFERQKALEARRERVSERLERRLPEERQVPQQRELPVSVRAETVSRAVSMPDAAMQDIAQALVGLRHELKQDIADGLTREMNSLRAEIRGIKTEAPMGSLADDMRDDMQRLAESINQLGRQASPAETQGLRRDFEDLRLMIDGLAREDSVQKMDTRWGAVEDRLSGFDGKGMHSEINAIAYRLDDIKSQLGGMSANPMVHALEDKIVTMAQAVEMLGRHMEPDNKRMVSQFSAIDERLDEISRAIVASGRTSAAAPDNALINRLENRIAGLAEQIDMLAQPAVESALGHRIEALAARMEELANEETAARLEERLGQLSAMLERSQKTAQQPDFTGYLTDISRKIDALDQGSVNDVLAERLEHLSRRIEDLNIQPGSRAADDRFSRLEDRLFDIAERLENAQAAPLDDHDALRGLEAQIANLSTLISQPRSNLVSAPSAMSDEMEQRMGVLEEYMATSDEYIIEAARQAAEAVMEAYGRNGQTAMSTGGASDMAALSALADDLRTLEEISRSSDERTARTFEALHETLVQIAGRLERLDIRGEESHATRSQPVMPRASLTVGSHDDDMFADVDPWAEEENFKRETHALQGTELPPANQTGRKPDDIITAAADAVRAEADRAAIAEPQPAAKKSLLAGLAKRLPGARREEPAQPAQVRQYVDPTPSIDAANMIAPEEANQLLEPGSGAPDVKKILERVRAGQIGKDSASRGAASETEKADFIAAARRAAQMAADEADTLNKNSPRERISSGAPASSGVRRPIMMAVGAVLLAIMSYPLISAFIGGDEAPVQPPVAAIEENVAQETQQANAAATPVGEGAVTEQAASETVAKDRGVEPLPADTKVQEQAQLETTPEPAQDLQPLPSEEATDTAPMLTPETTTEGAQAKLETTPKAETAQPSVSGDAGKTVDVPAEITTASLVTAAKAGDPLALFEIGARYTEGRGLKTDLAAAAKWYQSSADAGFAPAQYRLANLYEKGTGVERDLAKAKQYYVLAADQGNASAMHNLAVLLATGGGGTPDYAAASGWFQKAADLGIRDSQFNLAILFARGNGVKQDLEESYKWFAVAARDGDKDAAQKRDEVANAMRPEQLESAKAKFDLWKPKALDTKANTAIVPDEWAGKGTNTASVDVGKAIRNIQAILNNNGFDAGKPDGQMGKKTVSAIKAFQTSVGQKATGEIDDALVRELLKRNKA